MSKTPNLFQRIFEDYYVVEIYTNGAKTPKTFHMKYIKRIDNNTLRGKLLDGHEIVYCTSEPFDYYIRKIY